MSAMTNERPITVDELYDAIHRVRDRNPYDGRTVAGRAWAGGAWEVMEEVKALLLGEWPEEAGEVPERVVAEAARLLLAGKKISAIKAVRAAGVGLDLRAAKDFVESLPEHATWARSPVPHTAEVQS